MKALIRTVAIESLWSLGILLGGATPAGAITINITYCEEDPSPYEVNNVTGTTIVGLFNAAAAIWEDYLPNSGTYNICVSWDSDLDDDPQDNVLGSADSFSGDIDLLADPLNGGTLEVPAPWYIDSTPADHSEFDLARIEALTLSQAQINSFFKGSPLPPSLEIGYRGPATGGFGAEGKYDALTVALHEIGHILGVNAASGDAWIPPASMTGGAVVAIDNTEEDDAHIAAPTALMFPSPVSLGGRTLPSTIDILAVVDDEDFTMADLPRQAFLVAQGDENDPDFSWHVGPFFWEGGSQPGTDDHARITNGARVALQTGDVNIESLVVSGGSALKTQNRAMLVDGLTRLFGDLPSQIIVGSGGSLETTDLRIGGAQPVLVLDGGVLIVNKRAEVVIEGENQFGGKIVGHGNVHVSERLENDGVIRAEGGTLTLMTLPFATEVWDLDGSGQGQIQALDGDLIVHGPHEGEFDNVMRIGPGRLVDLDSFWVMGDGGDLLLNGAPGSPATFHGNGAEISGQVVADKHGVLEGGGFLFVNAMLSVPDADDLLELRFPSTFRGDPPGGRAVEGRGTLRQLSNIVVEGAVTVDAETFDWGNSEGGVATAINALIVEPASLLTILSESTGTAGNEYRGTILLNNGVMDVQELPGWTLPTDLAGADKTLGTLVLNNNQELTPAPRLLGAELTLGGVIRAEGGIGYIDPDLVTRPTAEIEVQVAAELVLGGHVTYDGPMVHGLGTLHQSGDATVVSPTTMATDVYDWDGDLSTPSEMTIAPGASLTITSQQIDVGPPADDGYRGQVTVADSAALIVTTSGPWRLDGTMRLEGQPVPTPSVIVDGSDLINHGAIEGNGRIQASLENHGTLRPGLSAGALRFDAGFELASDGLVEIEIGGLTPLSEYDRIIVNQFGTANLAGDLLVNLIDGFLPDADATFTILTAGVVSGAFDHELKSGLPPGLNYKVSYNSDSVVLALFAGFTADFDGDGDVDGDDMAIWQGSFGVDAGGDADGDGDTDGADYLIIQQQLGGGLPAVASSDVVPEPASWALAALGMAGLGRVASRPGRKMCEMEES
jgi:hypothetical protein